MDTGFWIALAILLGLVVFGVGLVGLDCRLARQEFGVYFGFRALWLFCKLWHGVRPPNRDPLPRTGPAILISNHTSPADPIFLQCATRRIVTFLMAREYHDIWFLRPIFELAKPILVNRTGQDTAAVRATLRALGRGAVIGVFPEGGIHLDADSLGPAKPGTALLALLTKVPVIPARVERPVHTNRLIEGIMRPARARVYFGPAVDLGQYYGTEPDEQVLEEVTGILMESIRNAGRAPDPQRSNTNSAGRSTS